MSATNCLKYWDICTTITIDAAVALWCNVQPREAGALTGSAACMDAKREAIINALQDGRLEYEGRAVPRGDGCGVWHDAALKELIEKGGVQIKKSSLRRWFEQLQIADRPAFLFEEARADELPDGSDRAEMNTMKALGIMALLLSKSKPAMSVGNRPNAAAIGEAVASLARQVFGEDVHGFAAFHKKVSRAIKLLDDQLQFQSCPTDWGKKD